MNFFAAVSGSDGLTLILIIALLIVGAVIGIASIVAWILNIKIFFAYWVTNRQRTSGGYTGATAAETLLERLGHHDIQVKKCGFFRALFFSNHYNPVKKTIYLRASTYNGANMTAVGLALQKVGIAVRDEQDSVIRKRWRLQKLSIFGPIFFIPIVIVGVVLDFVLAMMTDGAFGGIFTLIAALLGGAYFIASVVLSALNIKVEGRANVETLEIIKNQDFLNATEREYVAKVFKTYKLTYITEFLIGVLEIIRFIIKLLLAIVRSKNN